MNPAPAAAQAAASASAIASAWSRPSSWHGPAISVSGRSLATASSPIRTVFAFAPRLGHPVLPFPEPGLSLERAALRQPPRRGLDPGRPPLLAARQRRRGGTVMLEDIRGKGRSSPEPVPASARRRRSRSRGLGARVAVHFNRSARPRPRRSRGRSAPPAARRCWSRGDLATAEAGAEVVEGSGRGARRGSTFSSTMPARSCGASHSASSTSRSTRRRSTSTFAR